MINKLNKTLASIVLSTSFLLQGCTGAAAVSGASAALDHYRIQQSVEDRILSMKVQSAIYEVPRLYDNSSITTATFNKIVLLTGQAKSEEIKQDIEKSIAKFSEIKGIYNFISVKDPAPLTTVSHDAWLTTKIKGELLTKANIDSGNIKVVSDDGTVYLMGLVTNEQARVAEKIARKTSGVSHVVTMFQYIHISPYPEKQTA